MAHIQIHPRKGGGYELLVDGVDIGPAVIADSVHVSFGFDDVRRVCDGPRPVVTLSLAAHTLDADLPESIVEAMRVTEDSDA